MEQADATSRGQGRWPWGWLRRGRRPPEAGARPAGTGAGGPEQRGPGRPAGPSWAASAPAPAFADAPGALQPARAGAPWRAVEPVPPGLAIRRAYRHLAGRWGSTTRESLRVVCLPGMVWAGPGLAVLGLGDAMVLARPRPDRRVQIYHVNVDQAATWSAGRLEPDPLAPWTHPLRHLLFGWLQRGVELTGVDAALVCTGEVPWPTTAVALAACALSGWRPLWTGTEAVRPGGAAWLTPRVASELPWPGRWQAMVRAALGAASYLPPAGRPGTWRGGLWVGLSDPGEAHPGGSESGLGRLGEGIAPDYGGCVRIWLGRTAPARADLAWPPAGSSHAAGERAERSAAEAALLEAIRQGEAGAAVRLLARLAGGLQGGPGLPLYALVEGTEDPGSLTSVPCGVAVPDGQGDHGTSPAGDLLAAAASADPRPWLCAVARR